MAEAFLAATFFGAFLVVFFAAVFLIALDFPAFFAVFFVAVFLAVFAAALAKQGLEIDFLKLPSHYHFMQFIHIKQQRKGIIVFSE